MYFAPICYCTCAYILTDKVFYNVPPQKMHFKNKYTKEKKYKNLKKEDQHSRNKKWNPKGHWTYLGKIQKKWEYDIITNQTVY